jgi:hypothetical protein
MVSVWRKVSDIWHLSNGARQFQERLRRRRCASSSSSAVALQALEAEASPPNPWIWIKIWIRIREHQKPLRARIYRCRSYRNYRGIILSHISFAKFWPRLNMIFSPYISFLERKSSFLLKRDSYSLVIFVLFCGYCKSTLVNFVVAILSLLNF